MDFLHEAIPLLERAEKEEGAARKASGEEFIGIVNVSDDARRKCRRRKEKKRWNKVDGLMNGELDEKAEAETSRVRKGRRKS